MMVHGGSLIEAESSFLVGNQELGDDAFHWVESGRMRSELNLDIGVSTRSGALSRISPYSPICRFVWSIVQEIMIGALRCISSSAHHFAAVITESHRNGRRQENLHSGRLHVCRRAQLAVDYQRSQFATCISRVPIRRRPATRPIVQRSVRVSIVPSGRHIRSSHGSCRHWGAISQARSSPILQRLAL